MLLPILVGAVAPTITAPPLPLVEGYEVTPTDQVLRQSFEAGPGRARRRFFTPFERINVAWKFDDQEFQEFREWFYSQDGANGGAAWYWQNLAHGTGGVVPTQARFGSTYKATVIGPLKWKVTATLEVRDA
jgi:hypothetical protein